MNKIFKNKKLKMENDKKLEQAKKKVKTLSVMNGIFTSLFFVIALIFSKENKNILYIFIGVYVIIEIIYMIYFYKQLEEIKNGLKK
ncbi:hypothetical protein DLH72_00695 [Candidatus Gracilibacteria bacterium]|nr:MAG: hypothetical protein DLH72_00695 [Candidatus Gracilibacteria bacterium]